MLASFAEKRRFIVYLLCAPSLLPLFARRVLSCFVCGTLLALIIHLIHLTDLPDTSVLGQQIQNAMKVTFGLIHN